ncbi:ABC transporter substrate-binding protein [Roseomonas terrae]|jgi:peptide/nickel transport system substrate-binding protein|uniref:ABC transporter substrate-binding protein n=1 Tax=Neoroseomonas terrae TaxID=424799 RepID=A0ABS5EGR3_9PROT|nr:ABC transporter substrate-binding protein [Neoroseomonas terrae]MBR0650212.1 ABC transporter substrate-binding protein [Neoroseomonas terrae]
MLRATRRTALLTAAAATLPRIALGQADQRPSLTIAVQKLSNSNTLEPPREQSNVGFRISNLFAEPLIETDWRGDLSAKPGLATAWRRTGERTLEFDLREGVRFHDGRTITAEDVVFSFGERLFGSDPSRADTAGRDGVLAGGTGKEPPSEVVAVSRQAFPGLQRMEVVRPGVVRFVNAQPDVTLEARAQQNIGVIFSRTAFADAESWLAWARRPVGTGPYRIVELRPDSALTLEAHDDYWGGRPPLRRIRLVEVPEVSSRLNGLFSGEFDLACDISPDLVSEVERNARFEVLGSPINNIRIMAMDRTNPVLADARVRRAMTHAVDRRVIVEALWAGRTEVPRGLQLENYGPMFLPDWENPRFDPAEARRLLRDAGYRGEPISYRLLNNYYTNQVSNAQIVVEMWRQVGLNVQIEMKENFDQLVARTPGRGIRDWSNTSTFGDPVAGLLRSYGPRTNAARYGEWTNEEFDRAAVALTTSNDMGQRRRLFRRMLEIVEREDPGYLVLHQAAAFTAKRKDLVWRASKGWPMLFGPGQVGTGA